MRHAVSPEDWRRGDELDAVVAAPGSHRVVFENEKVRVLEVSVPAGTREPEHPHRWTSVMITDTRARMPARLPGLESVGPDPAALADRRRLGVACRHVPLR